MNIKYLYVCIVFLLIAVISLITYIAMPKTMPECERLHYDDNLKLWGNIDAVPNGEAAQKIANVVIGEYLWLNYGEKFYPEEYNSEVTLNPQSGEWEIYYSTIPPEGYLAEGGAMHIYIRKDCGMITGLVFYL